MAYQPPQPIQGQPQPVVVGSGPRSFDHLDVWHIFEKTVMCFVAIAPVELFMDGNFSWSAVGRITVAAVLMASQMTARQWWKDNRVEMYSPVGPQKQEVKP